MADYRRRNTWRYPGYDYGSPGAVVVTLCTTHWQRLFGAVSDGVMHLNDAGEAVLECWHRLPERIPGIALDAIMPMPNHLHGIILLGTDPTLTASRHVLGDAVRSFKSASARVWADGVRAVRWEPYSGQLWQRRYYDSILNLERPIDPVRDHILSNPARWQAKYTNEMP